MTVKQTTVNGRKFNYWADIFERAEEEYKYSTENL